MSIVPWNYIKKTSNVYIFTKFLWCNNIFQITKEARSLQKQFFFIFYKLLHTCITRNNKTYIITLHSWNVAQDIVYCCFFLSCYLVWFDFWCFDATFSSILAISWRPVLVVEEAQHYVIKFVSDLRQIGGFLQVLRFPPPMK
jgi:hypothetical protein